jgi:hypothetical protein
MCLCRMKAWCNQKAEEASSAGYIAWTLKKRVRSGIFPVDAEGGR